MAVAQRVGEAHHSSSFVAAEMDVKPMGMGEKEGSKAHVISKCRRVGRRMGIDEQQGCVLSKVSVMACCLMMLSRHWPE